MTRRELIVVLLGAVLAMGACDRSVPPAAPPPRASTARVVVLSPALAGTLRWLDLGGIIVGRHGFDGWSDQSLPVCGDQAGFDYETLLRVNPTHILVEWGDRPLPDRMTSLAKERGWGVHNFSTLSLDDVAKTTDELAAMFAKGPVDPATPKPSQRLRGAWSKRPGPDLAGAGRVLMLVSASPPTALGPGSAHQEILLGLGGRAALDTGGTYQTLDAEDVLKLKPEAIVLIVPRKPGTPQEPASEAKLAELLGPLAKLNIPALQNRRVTLLDDPEGLLPGASLVRFADGLHAALVKWENRGATTPGAP